MDRKPVDLPAGVELVGRAIRIRFAWNKKRCCETLAFPQTPKGIAAAGNLCAQVKHLDKAGALSKEKYAELFPNSKKVVSSKQPIFFDYAQDWLDSLQIVESTRKGYKGVIQNYWIPHLASRPLDEITPMLMRKIATETPWTSPSRRKGVIRVITSIFNQAVSDELIMRNPALSIPATRSVKRELDPFSRDEADALIAKLYESTGGMQVIYAAFFEFSFYTGMRPGEAMALRWSEVDTSKRSARVCRIRIYGKIKERTKTKKSREVLLNDQALHALDKARPLTAARSDYVFAPEGNGDRSELFIRSETGPKRYWLSAMRKLGFRHRRMYDTRHTYATMCLMSGMNPAFIAAQLGHSVQVLLSTYAKWLSSPSDWDELAKLNLPKKSGTDLVQGKRQ
ncbi:MULTISPECIES: tyrosine-type recombinase/integrase [unclassified Pseudomonas]|uniref:tyrosine-type recombinase/integrase n=1 Tax=unclassified Pseudomonas TaxID=196821 RepID=UPI002B225B4E|nr:MULTISPECIES: tyrosine-type recombinase/integrase [unclassified Pseudomonas]MEA9994281.1 tyrosine-type recombinase/integrase [Pseudomonas sp. AA4]MEB0088542.1 tyrosine-type recombinase/integrase [Pseudomonas sp. RTI1]MEB0126535.1 tyrosine-type recombinase/integrase [Pseudomonas sp. CCC1.2]MEB0154652.1 tyrosine-type recombinase/integrase [Pseudomonas sp. CCC4.3]MEB0221131.1 tyrosine-type recombinase/integrase [Pseudomonas sp. AB12(2023)]